MVIFVLHGGLGALGSQNKGPKTLARHLNILQFRLDDENTRRVVRFALRLQADFEQRTFRGSDTRPGGRGPDASFTRTLPLSARFNC